MSTIKCLMGVEVFEVSDKYMFALRKAQEPNPDRIFDVLPEYTINENEGAKVKNSLIVARYYHQFVGMFEGEGRKYLYFNLHTLDSHLDYEISGCGIEDLFKDLDFKKILSIFAPHNVDDLSHFVLPRENYLIVELTYTSSYDNYSGATEYEMEADITGYLNDKLEPVYFQNN
jgi:hypothetical protein